MIPVMYSRDDVLRRLHGTAAVYKGKVHFVSARDAYYKDNYLPLALDEVYLYPWTFRADETIGYEKAKVIKVKYTDPDVKIKGIAGGYVNSSSHNDVAMIVRDPTRDTHIGFHPHNVSVKSNSQFNVGRSFYSDQVAACILGQYPSFNDCLETVKSSSGVKGRAFGNEYAVIKLDSNLTKLEIRGVGVAINIGKDSKFIPLNNKTFPIYEEELHEQGILVN